MKNKSSTKKTENKTAPKRRRTTKPFPNLDIKEPLEFTRKIFEFGSGQPVQRLTFFDSIGRSPDSGPSRSLITSANKYGLIKGSYKADNFEITSTGIDCVDDTKTERARTRALVKCAIEDIEIFNHLYYKFLGNKLPAKAALVDAASEYLNDEKKELSQEAVDTFVVNLEQVGLLKTLSGADRIVKIDVLLDSLPASDGPPTPFGNTARIEPTGQIITSETANFEKTAFFIAPIGDDDTEQRKHSDLFMGSLVEPAVEQFGLSVLRADKISAPGTITRQILQYIMESRIVIADLSFHNANVFYELAIRHMTKKPTIQLIRKADNIPFDLKDTRTIMIDTSDIYSLVPQIERYKSEISNQVRSALEGTGSYDNPIANYFPNSS